MIRLVNGEFEKDGASLGVAATRKRGRWQYRGVATGALYASGMTPAEFVSKFWFSELTEGDE